MTVEEATELYVEACRLRGLSPRTILYARLILKHFADYCAGRLDDLREATLETLMDFYRWIGKRKKPNGEPTTVRNQNRHIRVLRQVFKLLAQRNLILSDIGAELPLFHDPKSLPRGVMTKEQVLQLLRQPTLTTPNGFRDRTILEVLFSTGLRGGELCRLTLYDVDLPARLIHVIQAKGKKDRVVPVGKVAAGYLAEYLKNVRPLLMNGQAHAFVFPANNGTPFDTARLFYLVKTYRTQAHLPDNITTHSLRHTCATEMLKGGANIRHVQELLGHSSIKTTQVYTRVVITDLKKAHRRTAPSERRRVLDEVHFDSGEKPRWTDRRNSAAWRKRKRLAKTAKKG